MIQAKVNEIKRDVKIFSGRLGKVYKKILYKLYSKKQAQAPKIQIVGDIDKFKNKIITAPAELFLKFLPDKCIDLALIDPPYGINVQQQIAKKLGGKRLSERKYYWKMYDAATANWDNERPSAELFKEIMRVSKKQIIWGGNYFADLLPPSQGWLVWNKGQHGFSLADGELAWTNTDKALRIFDYGRSQFSADEKNERIHLTQKPIKLFKWCIEQAKLKQGAIVLDVFAGSCTTARACIEMGLDYICVDKDPDMIAKARKLTDKYKNQGKLFKPIEYKQEKLEV